MTGAYGNYRSYDEALKKGSKDLWLGCDREGRCRPCGQIHDMQKRSYSDSPKRDFWCLQNYTKGCPDPKPAPRHQLNRRGRCVVCGVTPLVKSVHSTGTMTGQ